MVGWLLAGQGVTERDRTGQYRIGLGWFRCSMHCRLLYMCTVVSDEISGCGELR